MHLSVRSPGGSARVRSPEGTPRSGWTRGPAGKAIRSRARTSGIVSIARRRFRRPPHAEGAVHRVTRPAGEHCPSVAMDGQLDRCTGGRQTTARSRPSRHQRATSCHRRPMPRAVTHLKQHFEGRWRTPVTGAHRAMRRSYSAWRASRRDARRYTRRRPCGRRVGETLSRSMTPGTAVPRQRIPQTRSNWSNPMSALLSVPTLSQARRLLGLK